MTNMVEISIFLSLLPLKLCGKEGHQGIHEGLPCSMAAGIPIVCQGA